MTSNRGCGHLWVEHGMTLLHALGRALYFRRCGVCGFTEYRDQNEPVQR